MNSDFYIHNFFSGHARFASYFIQKLVAAFVTIIYSIYKRRHINRERHCSSASCFLVIGMFVWFWKRIILLRLLLLIIKSYRPTDLLVVSLCDLRYSIHFVLYRVSVLMQCRSWSCPLYSTLFGYTYSCICNFSPSIPWLLLSIQAGTCMKFVQNTKKILKYWFNFNAFCNVLNVKWI